MKRQKKTSAYRVIEEAVSSGDDLPLDLALVLGSLLIAAYIRSRLHSKPRLPIKTTDDKMLPTTNSGGVFLIQGDDMKRFYLTILILVFAALACGSETATPAPGSTSAPISTTAPGETSAPAATTAPAVTMGQVGERVEANGIALTVSSVTALDNMGGFSEPAEGNIFLVVDVTIESVTEDAAAYNPLYFDVKDSEGFEYTYNFNAPAPTLKSGELSAGEKARGNVAFEVPATAKGLVLSYKAIDFSGDDAIEFDLGDAPAP